MTVSGLCNHLLQLLHEEDSNVYDTIIDFLCIVHAWGGGGDGECVGLSYLSKRSRVGMQWLFLVTAPTGVFQAAC